MDTIMDTAQMGCVKKTVTRPSEMIMACLKFVSSMGPRIKARTSGASSY